MDGIIAGGQDGTLDILGQLPSLKRYTPISLCFPVADASSHPAIISTLTGGLERLSTDFPWLACKVVAEGASKGNSGILKFKPFEKTPRLVVKDLRNDSLIPTMDALRQARFPYSLLDDSILNGVHVGTCDGVALELPVLVVQATFIIGGLILTIAAQHCAMDGAGEGQVIHLLSKACSGEEFTADELSSGNLERRDLIPLLDSSYRPGPELDYLIEKPVSTVDPSVNGLSANPAQRPPPKYTFAYFIFDATSLADIKDLTSKTMTLTSGYLSTDDALSAFIWQSIARARLYRLHPTTETRMLRAVDVRRYFKVPSTYPGAMMSLNIHKRSLQKLADEAPGAVASELRLGVDPQKSDLEYRNRAVATYYDRTPDKTTIPVAAGLDVSKDLKVSSWSKLNCYELDFNLGLGKPEGVRRPRQQPSEGSCYFMPKARDGEIAVAISLRDKDMERLKADEEFAKHATYVG